jgi:hypothetical protein
VTGQPRPYSGSRSGSGPLTRPPRTPVPVPRPPRSRSRVRPSPGPASVPVPVPRPSRVRVRAGPGPGSASALVPGLRPSRSRVRVRVRPEPRTAASPRRHLRPGPPASDHRTCRRARGCSPPHSSHPPREPLQGVVLQVREDFWAVCAQKASPPPEGHSPNAAQRPSHLDSHTTMCVLPLQVRFSAACAENVPTPVIPPTAGTHGPGVTPEGMSKRPGPEPPHAFRAHLASYALGPLPPTPHLLHPMGTQAPSYAHGHPTPTAIAHGHPTSIATLGAHLTGPAPHAHPTRLHPAHEPTCPAPVPSNPRPIPPPG